MKAGNVFIRLAEMELGENVGADMFGCAGGEGGDRAVGKALAQAAELAVLGTEFVSPLGDAVGFVDGEKRDGHLLEPTQRIGAGEALGRKIKQTISSGAGVADDFGLLVVTEKAIQDGGGDSHLRELRGLVLHERDQRRDDDRGALGNYCGQLVAERLASASRHDDAGVASGEQACGRLALAAGGRSRIPSSGGAE